ncbi:hypothetical protein BB560_005658 [Smittium megazygosporum]|uniref:CBM1 domain-containing protein n=1 Tax=Smittium megazygosporum TaxID=133381 RepID=A0A2T9Z1S3_9FUNG|nr:hypothetical protein BB560_005658 [Smittium megazygosporum]
MKFLSILSVLAFVAVSQSASIPDQTLAKRQENGAPCDEEGKMVCGTEYQQFYMQCVHGAWVQRDNPPGTKCVYNYENDSVYFDFSDPEQ